MSDIVLFEVDTTDDFDKKMERFVRKKKFKKLPKQIAELGVDLERGKFDGTHIRSVEQPIKHDVYKLRLPNEDTQEGKSNGYRVIYAVMAEEKLVLLVAIYYKKEQPDVSDNFVDGLIEGYLLAQTD
jgi:mRNA-degrading endonuclease RelE of RelBE toxin-antitoxin system